jgi:predicted DNA binding CopG/RHH family protein
MAKSNKLSRKEILERNSHVKFGTGELDPDEFNPIYGRAHISIKIPIDVLDAYRHEAAARGTKYQSLLNEIIQLAASEFKLGKAKLDPLNELLALVNRSAALAKRIKKGSR